jgi:magnesium transporter
LTETASTPPEVETIEQLIESQQIDALQAQLAQIHPADIAVLLDELDTADAVTLFELLPVDVASEVLDETGSPVRQELVDKVADERLADLLEELPVDDAVEFLEDLPDEVSDRLIGLMEPEEAAEVQRSLGYEEQTAGRLMARDVVALRRQWTVGETFDYLRALEDAETLHYLYVVDRDNRLIGLVPLRKLIMARPEATIESIMNTSVVSAPVNADQEELAELVSRYDFFVIPVVDEQKRLLGVVTADDILDVLEEEATEDIQRLGGSEPLDQPYFAVSIFQVFRKRVGWLLILFLAATLTGTVTSLFQELLETAVVLTVFIPLVIGTGGNAGSQTVATIIRALTLEELRLNNVLSALRREISVGLLLGGAMSLVGILYIRLFFPQVGGPISVVVGLTLPAVVVWSTTVATLVPTLADRFHIDPAVISGPMIATIVDATGLLIYFLLAQQLLGL